MTTARTLGVRGLTGQPVGGGSQIVIPMNQIGLTGRYPRQYSNIVTLEGTTNKDYIIGTHQATKNDVYILDDVYRNAGTKKNDLKFLFRPYKASDSVQASSSINDNGGTPAPTLTLKSAFKNEDSFGTWDNSTGFTIEHVSALSFTVETETTANQTTGIVLNSVVGIVVNDVLKVTVSSIDYNLKVTAINESAKTIDIAIDGTTPIFPVGTVVNVMYFRIVSYRKSDKGFVKKQENLFTETNLTMESGHPNYAVTVLQNHPLFKGVDGLSSNLYWKKFPAENSTVVFLASGSDGTAPSTVSDWESIQPYFTDTKINFFLNTGTTDKDVRKNYEVWSRSIDSFPLYLQPIQDYANDWESLENEGKGFLVSEGWSQTALFYGWRYVSDPIGDTGSKKIPVIGKVLGKWMYAIHSGSTHRGLSEAEFVLDGDVTGSQKIYEDDMNVWNGTVRTRLYNAGVNIVQYVQGTGLLTRNFRSPSNDYLARDLHIHAINQLLKFWAEEFLKDLEGKAAKFLEVQKKAIQVENQLLIPLHQGSFPPYVVSETAGVNGSGAFRDVNENDEVASVSDIARVIVDRFNNPKSSFNNGDVNMDNGWVPYSLIRSLYYTVYPEERG